MEATYCLWFVSYQIDNIKVTIIMYECDEIISFGPHMLEWTNYKGMFALVPLSNGFLVLLLVRQCSQVDRSTLS